MLGSLPLTPNGKVDRGALPAPAQADQSWRRLCADPRIPTEELLANIWAEVLKLDKVGIHDNFFDLGGHSLLATKAYFPCRYNLSGRDSIALFVRDAHRGGLGRAD